MNVHLSLTDILFLKNDSRCSALNLVILITKYYIYGCRTNEKSVDFQGLQNKLKLYFDVEKYMYLINGKEAEFNERWGKIRNIF